MSTDPSNTSSSTAEEGGRDGALPTSASSRPRPLPLRFSSGLPISPAEDYLRQYCPFPTPSSSSRIREAKKKKVNMGEVEKEKNNAAAEEEGMVVGRGEEGVHYGTWCVLHDDIAPYHFASSSSSSPSSSSSLCYLGDGVVFRPPPLLAFSLRERYTITSTTTTTGGGEQPPAAAAPSRRGGPASSPLLFHVSIGSHTFVGKGAVSEAVRLEDYVFIAPRAVLGAQVEAREGACVTAGSVIPAESILAPYTVYDGVPAVPRGKLEPVSHRQIMCELLRRLTETGKGEE